MKKLFSFLVVAAMAFAATAQIPNAGFENWTGVPPSENPDGWWTVNMVIPAGGVSKSTDANSGNYAASAQVVSIGGGTNFPGVLALGDPLNDATASGIPFTGRPDTLKVWTKYNTLGNDVVLVVITLTKWSVTGDTATIVGGGGGSISGTQANYIQGIIPIEYENSLTPDSMQIIVMVGDIQSSTPSGTVGSYVLVDDFELVGNLTVKVSDIIAANKINVYPNPNDGSFNLDIPAALDNSILSIFDITGKEVFTKHINSGVLQLNTNASPGKYFVKIQNEKHTVNRSIIIK